MLKLDIYVMQGAQHELGGNLTPSWPLLSLSPEQSLYPAASCLLPRTPACRSFLGEDVIRNVKNLRL